MGNAIDNAAVAASVRNDGMRLTNSNNGMGQVGIPQPQHPNNRINHHHQRRQQQQYPIQQSQQIQPQMNAAGMMGSGFGGELVNSGNVWNGQQSMMNNGKSMGGNEWGNEVIIGGASATTMYQQPVYPPPAMNSQQLIPHGTMYGQQGVQPMNGMNASINGMNYNTNLITHC